MNKKFNSSLTLWVRGRQFGILRREELCLDCPLLIHEDILMRAIMEAIGFGVRHDIELVKNHGRKVLSRMGIAEGGIKLASRKWANILASIESDLIFILAIALILSG